MSKYVKIRQIIGYDFKYKSWKFTYYFISEIEAIENRWLVTAAHHQLSRFNSLTERAETKQ